MKNLETEIAKYVKSKHSIWSDRTVSTVSPKLRTLAADFSDPYKNYKKLIREGYSKYTIKTYFVIASKFEQERFKTNRYQEFLKANTSAFKNCYKDKTRNLKSEEFKNFLMHYSKTNGNMFNLLVLMGTAGLRISEALDAKWSDIKDGMLWTVGKGGKQRAIPFDRDTLQKDEPADKIIGKVAYRFFFKRDMQPYTPHDFRAHYATYIANHPELNINDAALLLGHSDIKTTSRYIRSDIDRIARVLNKKA